MSIVDLRALGLRCGALVAVVLSLLLPAAAAAGGLVKIGVLAVRGADKTVEGYTPTAKYLGEQIPGYTFEIVPLTLPETPLRVGEKAIDFIVTQGAGYAAVEYEYGVTRIATMRKRGPGGKAFSEFAGVVFVPAGSDIQKFRDLKGRSFMAVDKTAFGGRWMAERELNEAGVEFEDFSRVEFSGFPQTDVVRAVLAGEVDAGTVRTGMLESMVAKGEIERRDFRVLGEVQTDGFPYVHSTRMYPEWAFAVLRHTDSELARKVAVALLSMPADHPAAKKSKTKGWAVPMDYQRVHELMKDLKVGAYVNLGKITLAQLLKQYWHVMLAVVLAVAGMAMAIIYVLGLNRRISESRRDMGILLDSVDQGFFTLNQEGVVSKEKSAIVERWLGAPPPGDRFSDYLGQVDETQGEWFAACWDMLMEDALPRDVALAQLPKTAVADGRTLSINYTPILVGETMDKLLVVMSDMTAEIERERAEREQRELVEMFKHLTSDKVGFMDFTRETEGLVATICQSAETDLDSLRRDIHTLKGNSGLFGLVSLAELCHQIEDHIEESRAPPSSSDKNDLRERWAQIRENLQSLTGSDEERGIELSPLEYSELIEAVATGVAREQLEATLRSWTLDRVSKRLDALSDQAINLGKRLGKSVRVQTDAAGLRVEGEHWAPFWSAVVHVLRNALDHGIELSDRRVEQGKAAFGTLRLSAEMADGRFVVAVSDDGGGIDWDKIRALAEAKGLPHERHEDLVDALFADGLSTRETVSEMSGRGVGMAAVKAATAARGGRIEVQSKMGEGTVVRFSFPPEQMAPYAAGGGEGSVATNTRPPVAATG